MNRKNYPFNLNLTILIFLVTFFTFHSEQEANQLNENPLDFTLKTLNGEEICLKNYRGEKIVHLLFWATWCPHCLMEMPKIKKLHNLQHKENLVFELPTHKCLTPYLPNFFL